MAYGSEIDLTGKEESAARRNGTTDSECGKNPEGRRIDVLRGVGAGGKMGMMKIVRSECAWLSPLLALESARSLPGIPE